MRPSSTRCVIPCVALWLPACHVGAGESTIDEVTLTGSGSNSVSDTGAGNDSPPDPTTLPPEETTDEPGYDSTDDGVDHKPAVCLPPVFGADAVPLNSACDIQLQLGGFDPVIEWKWGEDQFCGPPVAGQTIDTNGNGALDDGDRPLVFVYRSADVVALWGDGSGVAWEADGNYGHRSSSLALGDLDGDGWVEVVTANNSEVCALDARDGTEKWCSGDLGDSVDPNGYNYPAIADMDGDGQAEVVLGARIINSTGKVIGTGKLGKGASPWDGDPANPQGIMSAVVDLDGDGIQEVVTGSAAYDLDGNVVWQNGGLDGFVAVADFDLDGKGELIKSSGNQLFGMESDGAEVWGPVVFEGNAGPPAIDDLDGDGTPEFVVAAVDRLVALRWGGEPMWSVQIADGTGSAGPVLFDFERDGFPEVLYADEHAIRFFSGLDGSLKFLSNDHKSDTIFETPIVADIDGDGQVEIVLGHCQGDEAIGSLTVYGDAGGSWPPGRKIWNQHTYSITNIGERGAVPGTYSSNWLGDQQFNSFRSGDVGDRPGQYHDLQAEIVAVCEAMCEAGSVSVTARVRNAGTLAAPSGVAVTVRAGEDGPVLATQHTSQSIPGATAGEAFTFVLDAADIAGSEPFITVDDDSVGEAKLFECDEQNNTAAWPTPVCAGA